jgi:hypothetical protein
VSGTVLVIAIIGAFVLFGIAFGALAVIAGSGRRGDTARAARDHARSGSRPGTGWTDTTNTGWEEPPGPDEGEINDPPRWPGGPSRR